MRRRNAPHRPHQTLDCGVTKALDEPRDEYVGTLVNAWLERGGTASGVRAGTAYFDVGTLEGYRQAIRILAEHEDGPVRGAARAEDRL